ncbi:hypothetical protein PTKIN_Ptkin07bG0243400 [Pterospermum kingtungense]
MSLSLFLFFISLSFFFTPASSFSFDILNWDPPVNQATLGDKTSIVAITIIFIILGTLLVFGVVWVVIWALLRRRRLNLPIQAPNIVNPNTDGLELSVTGSTCRVLTYTQEEEGGDDQSCSVCFEEFEEAESLRLLPFVHGPNGSPFPTSEFKHSSILATVKKLFNMTTPFLTKRTVLN